MQSRTNDLIQALMTRAIAHRGKGMWQAVGLFLCLFISSIGQAQGWEVIFGSNKEDQGVAIIQTIDEGFIQVGFSESFGNDGDFDIYVVRTDVDGTLVWQRIFDEGIVEQPADIIQLPDGSYMIVGNANVIAPDGLSNSQVYLLQISDEGEMLDSWYFDNEGDTKRQRGEHIIQTEDGGFAIVGTSENAETNDKDVLVLRLESDGTERWRQEYDASRSDLGVGITEVENGFLFVANIKGDQGPDNDVAFYRINAEGGLVAVNVYGTENDNEEVNELIRTTDNNVVAVGSAGSFNRAYIMKSDLNGDTLWTREIDAAAFDDNLNAVTELNDGSLVAVGQTLPTAAKADILLLKMSSDGDLIWERNLGEEFATDKFGEDIAPATNGGFVLAGYSGEQEQVLINDLIFIRVDENGNYFTNMVRGKVFWSQDGCNPYEAGDPGMQEWLVTVTDGETTYIGSTDEDGNYAIPVDLGSYDVTLLPKNGSWRICSPGTFPVDFTNGYDTLVYNFPVRVAGDGCPNLSVDVSSGVLFACSQAEYTISYCNYGSAIAEEPYIEIFLDEDLEYVGASQDTSLVTEGSLIFPLGSVPPLTCGSFTLTVNTPCAGVINQQSITVDAHIYPETYCDPVDPEWDNSTIKLRGRCENGEVVFTAKNEGTGTTDGTQRFVIVEDLVVFLEGAQIPVLDPGQELQLGDPIPANQMGSTYRAIANQSMGHPGENFPTAVVEGCVQEGNSEYATGHVAQFPENDQDPFVDIDVQEIVTTTATANALIGHPKGYLDSIIVPSTDIEYTVLFANTEMDTLNRLVIRDSLPAELDLSSLQVGPASHPYAFELYNSGLLKITFDNLNLLPDGSDEAGTRGYVKFRLSQKPNLPVGTAIENSAAVYFDFFAPKRTNSVRHIIGCDNFLTTGCITVDVDEPPLADGSMIRVQPNPFTTQATFIIENCERCEQLEMIVRDAQGRLVRQVQFRGSSYNFERGDLTAGIYFFEIRQDYQILQTGKLLIQ